MELKAKRVYGGSIQFPALIFVNKNDDNVFTND